MTVIDIGGRLVGANAPCFIIAEAGVNHGGRVDAACHLVDLAADAGADAVKFQTFAADRLVTRQAPKADYQRRTTDAGQSQFEMLRALELSRADHESIIDRCRERQIRFLSSPFDDESAAMLDELGAPAFKVGSGELTNLPFLAQLAARGKPIILSTGMADLSEVESAVTTIRTAGNSPVLLLQCVSAYPAAPEDANLRAMRTMADAFGVPVGYSDHTLGNHVAVAAVALGACVIEKHLTSNRNLPGPDHQASTEPPDFAELVRAIRAVEAALGDGRKVPALHERSTADVARKSLVAAAEIPIGAVLTEDAIAIRRPGTGLPPAMRPQLIGRRARVRIPEGTLLTWDMLT